MTEWSFPGPAEPSSGELDREWAQFDEAVSGLASIVIGEDGDAGQAPLAQIATLAARAIPGADGAGVTLLEPGRPPTVVVSDPFVRQIDDIQYGIGEGPCITAAAERRTVRSGALGLDPAWPRFGPRAKDLGVNSVVSLPLVLDNDVLGALNVYAHKFDAFTPRAADVGELFAVPAAIAVHNVRLLLRAQLLAHQLQTALSSRAVIDRAIGITMSRHGGDAEEAFARLREISQRTNTKLSVVAQTMVDEAVRRAAARRRPS